MSLERELDEKDSFDQENGLTPRLQSRIRDERESHRDGQERSRERILHDIRRRLVEYGPSLKTGPPACAFLADLYLQTNFLSKRRTSFHFRGRQPGTIGV